MLAAGRLIALTLLCALGCASEQGAQSEPQSADFSGTSASPGGTGAKRVWTDPVDFLALRTEYGDRNDFPELCERDRPLREWFEAANAQDWQTVLASTEKWLDACPVDIDAHFFRTVALFQMGRPADGAAHKTWHRGLVDSVVRSGEGRSSASPYIVISIPEEYAVLRSLRLKRQSQSLLQGGIDAIGVTDESGISSTVYFRLVDAYWQRMDEMLEKAKQRE